MKYIDAINRHYARSDLCRRILDTLTKAGKDIDNLKPADLATFEEFHTGGKRETLNLAHLLSIDRKHKVLDIGCGVGGPARTLASEFGCHVTGVDLTREFVLAARMLSEKVGYNDKTSFEQADALSLPFDNESFDIIWMQHVVTNVADKAALFTEISRLLKPGGSLAFHEYLKGNEEKLRYPVFWAAESSISFLSTVEPMKRILTKSGFKERTWHDTTERSIAFFEKVSRSNQRGDRPPLGTRLILGEDASLKVANVLHNLRSGATLVVQAVYRK